MSFDWDKALNQAGAFIIANAPLAEQAATALGQPEISAGLSIGEKIIQAAMAGEPTAKALISQVQGGTPLTLVQVQEMETKYGADYLKTKADLLAAIAAAPA